jgi:hypothetical protein
MANAYVNTDKAVREDLLSVLTNLSPTDTQLVTGLGTSSASSRKHEWLTDTLSAVKSNAYGEGADASYNDLTNPTRLTNYTQILMQGFKVSDSEEAVDKAAFNSRYQYEATKALKMIKNDLEFAVMRGAMPSGMGTDSYAGVMAGVKSWLSLVTAQSGVSLTEKILNDYLQNVWDNGTEVNAIYAPMYLKRKISGFVAGATKNFDQSDKRLINVIDVYQSDAAKLVKLFPHRHVSIVGTETNYDMVGINEDLFKIAYLRKPTIREMAKDGDATKGNVVIEATLECLHQHGGFKATAHL